MRSLRQWHSFRRLFFKWLLYARLLMQSAATPLALFALLLFSAPDEFVLRTRLQYDG